MHLTGSLMAPALPPHPSHPCVLPWVLLWGLVLRMVSTRINPFVRVRPSLGACNKWERSTCKTSLHPCLAFNAPGIKSLRLEGWRHYFVSAAACLVSALTWKSWEI